MAWTFTVSDLNEYVARSLASDPMLRDIRVTGEISNFKAHSSGHWYFDLKDERGRMSCVMYRQNHLRLAAPAEGERVILSGAPGLYAVTGRYQFYAQGMEKDGQGELYKKYLLLPSLILLTGLYVMLKPMKPLEMAMLILGWCMLLYGTAELIYALKFYRNKKLWQQSQQQPQLDTYEEIKEDITEG